MRPLGIAILLCASASGASIPPTQEVLRLAGNALQGFWDQLSNVNCVENVQQVKLGPNAKPLYKLNSSFDYVVVLQLTGNDILMEESRVPLAKVDESKNQPLLLTNGFSTLAFIFHPVFQSAFEYSAPASVTVEGRALLEVRFRHLPGRRSPSVLKVKNRDYPLDWQGTAWIDPVTGAIARISASLMPGLEDLGLKTLSADVRYAPVRFKDQSAEYWLPQTATIEVETARQHWRNIHSFDRYRVFAVDVTSKTEVPK